MQEIKKKKSKTTATNSTGDCRQDLLLSTLKDFYKNKRNLNQLLPIIKGESNISLRLLDWFAANYSNTYNVNYSIRDSKTGKVKRFFVHSSYKAQLKAYSKKQFDPFCRGKTIMFQYNSKYSIETTVRQLNFMRWIIKNKIIYYVKKHQESIEKDMNNSIRHYNRNKSTTSSNTSGGTISGSTNASSIKRRKKKELSIPVNRKVNKHNITITVNFD